MNRPSISVVIPTYERRDALVQTLAALGRRTFPAEDFEAVVVVDASHDDTLGTLRASREDELISTLSQIAPLD